MPTPNVGDTITFTVTLTDNGPTRPPTCQVTDLLPAGLTFVSATPSQGTLRQRDRRLDRRHGRHIGAADTLLIQARVVSPDPQTNTATISHADQFDPNPGNNTASTPETPQQADLALDQDREQPDPQRRRHHHLHRHPDQQRARRGHRTSQVTDLLPGGLTFVSATPSQGTYDSRHRRLDRRHGHNVGTPQTLVIHATGRQPRPADQHGDNQATPTSSTPIPANNSASATETPQQADLALAKTVEQRRRPTSATRSPSRSR